MDASVYNYNGAKSKQGKRKALVPHQSITKKIETPQVQ